MTDMSDKRRTLFPAIEPYRRGHLDVGDGHTMYFEECGNPQGKPVAMVHGGPGGGSNPSMRRFHDPESYRIILFDQRGCGRSEPHASLDCNTTWHLVADMDRLREHLEIDRWQLCGGSWGSALSLAYGESHPDKVTEMILRGIFTVRREEIQWFYQEGCSWLFPENHARFAQVIPPEERDDLVTAYHRRLVGEDHGEMVRAAVAWSQWEASTLTVAPDPTRVAAFGRERYAMAFARIEAHYFVNRGFMECDDQLLRNVGRIRHIPATIVQGRYDVVTPVRTAFELAAAWPEAELRIVDDAGHAMSEPGITDEIVSAGERYGAPVTAVLSQETVV